MYDVTWAGGLYNCNYLINYFPIHTKTDLRMFEVSKFIIFSLKQMWLVAWLRLRQVFERKLGTNDNMFVIHGLVNRFINDNKKLYKLINYGITGKKLQLIKSLYLNIKSRVKFENKLSDSFSCLLGAQQGDCMSPFICAMYVNDLEECISVNDFQGVI